MKERIAFGSSPNPDRLDRGGLGPSGAVAPILVGHHPTMQESAFVEPRQPGAHPEVRTSDDQTPGTR